MEYMGYTAGPIRFDLEENTFSGIVAGMRDVIHFESTTTKDLERAFRDSINAYLAFRGENGQES